MTSKHGWPLAAWLLVAGTYPLWLTLFSLAVEKPGNDVGGWVVLTGLVMTGGALGIAAVSYIAFRSAADRDRGLAWKRGAIVFVALTVLYALTPFGRALMSLVNW